MSATNAFAGEPTQQIPPHAGWLKATVVLATLMQVLDMTIANVALPHMQAALSANQESLSWVLTSYILASAVVLPITGWLSDRIGRRRLYLASVGCFIFASILCGMAATLEAMVLFRVAQGVSGAFLTPLAQTVLLDSTPPEKHGRAMALFGMGVVLGPVLGPITGGWLTENLDWRWVFFVNVPIGLIAMTGLWLLLPEAKRPPRRFDVTGFALLAVALASLQLMLDRGEGKDWFESVEIWIEMIVAVSAFWMFMVHILTSNTPLFDRTMLRDRNLAIAAVFQGVTGAIMVASMALLPLMLEGLLGYPVFDAGLLLATRGIGVILTMSVVGVLMERLAPSILISVGLMIVAMSLWKMSQWSLDVSGMTVGINGFIQGLGVGLLFVPISAVAFATLPARYRTDGSVMLNLTRSLGSSAGVSIVLAIFNRNAAVSHSDLVQYVTPYNMIDPTSLGLPEGLSQSVWIAFNSEVARQATMIAFVDDFHFVMIFTLCAIPLAFLIRRPREKTRLDIPHLVE